MTSVSSFGQEVQVRHILRREGGAWVKGGWGWRRGEEEEGEGESEKHQVTSKSGRHRPHSQRNPAKRKIEASEGSSLTQPIANVAENDRSYSDTACGQGLVPAHVFVLVNGPMERR